MKKAHISHLSLNTSLFSAFFIMTLMSKTCYADDGQTALVQSDRSNLVIIAIAMIAAGVFMILYARKKAETERKIKEAEEEKAIDKQIEDDQKNERNLFPSLQNKTVVFSSSNEELLDKLNQRFYLKVKQCEKDKIEDTVKQERTDLLIIDIKDEEEFEEFLSRKEGALAKCPVALLIDDGFYPEIKERLLNLKLKKACDSFVLQSTDIDLKMVMMILPILKPELRSNTSLRYLAKIAILLGNPAAARIIYLYISGRNIKRIVEKKEFGFYQCVAIISNIAKILELDTVVEIARLINDIGSIKKAVDKDAGIKEIGYGVLSAKDIVDHAIKIKEKI